ncbi:hypothetical protein CPB86DRAFT_312671 [Serendipita vermifera]|nr:hypothetical protein CPB86DRAFT_312671 [Serendipita vermifera]
MGGGGHYPYPKEVWSPAGGWWTRPANWKSNTLIIVGGIGALSYLVFRATAPLETRTTTPARRIPTMSYQRQFQKEESHSSSE